MNCIKFVIFLTMKKSYNIGLEIEKRVIKYLELSGYKLIEHRFKTRYGEIDIIMEDEIKRLLVCFEVKYRKDINDANFAISARQIARISDALEHFLSENIEYMNHDRRIDAVFCDDNKIRIVENLTI